MSAKQDTQLQECHRVISTVVREASNKRVNEVPPVLLRLKPVLFSKSLSVKQLRKVKESIWLSDLLHVNVEALRQDFAKVQGQWATAAELASILAAICGGLHPKENRTGQSYAEQIKEYNDILLPTSADSLLILANNLLEKEQQSVDSGFEVSELKHFQSILDSLLHVCRSHRQCIERVLQSPYLLHLLITDLVHHCNVVLSFLHDLVAIDNSLLLTLPPDVLHGLFDELVFKLSGEQERVAVLSLELMATATTVNPSMMDFISSRYTGIMELAIKWNKQRSGNTADFISQLQVQAVVESQDAVHHRAAATIQAAWRGHSSRRKVKKMQRGIRKFQQMYRRRKARKLKEAEETRAVKTTSMAKELDQKTKQLTFHEKQLSLMEQLPASEVNRFVTQQENTAATAIQSWWRSRLARDRYNELRKETKLSQSATVIQRAFRQYRRRKSIRDSDTNHIFRRVEGAEREALQGEIARYQQHHPSSYKSEAQARELHERVQSLTEHFYLSRIEQHGKDVRRTKLLSKLNHSCEVLLGAPNLSDFYTMPDTSTTFTTGSAAVSKMAQTAHREELRALNTPWWKRPTPDDEDSVLSLL